MLAGGTHRRARLHGHPVSGWPSEVWILHPIYETDALPSGLTHDEARRIELAAGTAQADVALGLNLDEIPGSVLTGSGMGTSEHPGPRWRRLRWRELSARLGIPPWRADVPPRELGWSSTPDLQRRGAWMEPRKNIDLSGS